MTPEAIGDYVAGPSHVLPTARSARYASGLSVLDFLKRTSLMRYDQRALQALGVESPFALARGFRLASGLLSWGALLALILAVRHWFPSARWRRAAYLSLALPYFVPYLAARVSSESASTTFLLLGGQMATYALVAVLLLALAAAHTARWALWQPWRTLRHPLVWVLHAAYLWLPVHLLLRAGATLDAWPLGPATHALTLGTIGGMTIGMITRTALGHTGRPLQAGPFETTAFVAMQAAALVRVAVPLLWPAGLLMAVHLSATLWVLAFVAYLARYVGILSRPRLDGKPG